MAIQKNKKIDAWGIFSGILTIIVVIILHYAFNLGEVQESSKKEKQSRDLPLQRYGSGGR